MERSSHKAVVTIQRIAALMGIGAMTASGIYLKRQAELMQSMKQELKGIHPELSSELEHDFRYYQSMIHKDLVSTMIICILAFLILAVFGMRLYRQKKAAEIKAAQQNLEALLQVLENYQKGDSDYDRIEFVNDTELDSYWRKVENALRIHGYQLREIRESLSNEQKSIKGLVTDISHQLKTPLATIRMNHELALDTTLCVEERAEFMKQEELGMERLEQLMNELVNVSRLESNMIQVKPTMGRIKDLIATAAAIVLSKAEQKQIQMVVQCEENTEVSYDPKWIPEAVANILDNAVKYSPERSTITISAHQLPTVVILEIEDEGIGISKQEVHKIYQRFYRGEQAKEMDQTGAGVGLYLARTILEQQGGTISARRKQQGSIFRITLPR